MNLSTRQRMKAHRERKANIAAKRPKVETWAERRDRERAEKMKRQAPQLALAAMMMGVAPTSASISDRLLDAFFAEPNWPPSRRFP